MIISELPKYYKQLLSTGALDNIANIVHFGGCTALCIDGAQKKTFVSELQLDIIVYVHFLYVGGLSREAACINILFTYKTSTQLFTSLEGYSDTIRFRVPNRFDFLLQNTAGERLNYKSERLTVISPK